MRHLRIVLAVAIMAFAAFGFAAAQDATSTPLPETAAPEATTIPEATVVPETEATEIEPSVYMGIQFDAADHGVQVIAVAADSPAEAAGILVGDVVNAINGTEVSEDDVREIVQGFAVGETVTVELTRDGEVMSLDVTLAEAPAEAAPSPFMGILFEAADEGVLVIDILAGSPAEAAGIEVGDVVTAINGEAVTQDTVRSILASFAVGDTVTLDVRRGEESLSLDVVLGEEPLTPQFRGRGDRTPRFEMFEVERPRLGIGIDDSETGVIVNEVAEGSPAEAAGVLVGDIVTAINGEAVATPQEAAEAVAQAIATAVVGEFDVTVTVTRGEESLDLVATLVKPEMPVIPAIPDMPGFGGRGRDDRGFGPGMGGFNLIPREGEEGAFDLVVPFRPADPAAVTDEVIAALADLGIRIVPREGDEGQFDLYVPAETLGEMEGGFILPHLDMFRGMMPEGFEFHFDGPMGRGFEIPDVLIPTVPAPEGEGSA
jgi:S1-C subfamily serine protease